MIPKIKGSDVQLFVIQSVYKKSSNKENGKFVKEGFCKVWFDKRELGPWGQYIGSKGEVAKNRTLVFNKSTQSYYTVAHSLKEMEEVLQAQDTIGYKTN